MESSNNLGYSYYMPEGGLLKLKSLCPTNYCDIFGVFDRYLAPAYHHDRCERSVQMKLYTMHKREFVMIFIGFFVALGMLICIGLVGPPITWSSELLATSLKNVSESILPTGPFAFPTPVVTPYHQQLWVIAKIETENREGEAFEKSFIVSIVLYGENSQGSLVKLSMPTSRTRHLNCPVDGGDCEPIALLHLGFIEYRKYFIVMQFSGLENVNQRYHLREIHLFFKTYNPSFTQLEISFRFVYCIASFMITCWFLYNLRKYVTSDWSLEQKWMSVLLPLLFLYNNPWFPLMFLTNWTYPGMFDAVFQVTFLAGLFLFWLSIYHGLRQVERKFLTFYLPKFILVGSLWMSAIMFACWQKINTTADPTFDFELDTTRFNNLKTFFIVCGTIYVLDLTYMVYKAYSELRSMPYFDLRLKFLTGLMLIVIKISMVVTYMRFGMDILEDHFISNLSTKYSSSAEFMSFYGLLNLYVYTMVFVYSPSASVTHSSSQITKDNPSFSMVNDSDEDVIYGSDNEDEAKTPLNLHSLSHGSNQHHDDSD